MARKKRIMTDKAPKHPLFPQAVAFGNLVFTSGQVSKDPVTNEYIKDDIAGQTRRALTNLKSTLEAAGSSLELVLQATIFITDMSLKPEMNAVYKEFFPSDGPARATVAVKSLDDGMDMEIQVIAGITDE